jgi:hypothetical protein
MAASESQHRNTSARWFFFAVQGLLSLAWCGLLAERNLSDRSIWQSGALSDVCVWSIVICTAVLLFVLPWFWAALRRVALLGWVMGALSLVCFALLSGHR